MNFHEKVEPLKEEEKSSSIAQPTESAELAKLFDALAKSQLEMNIARKDSVNPFFKSKYADLASIVKASRPFLSKNNICVIQRTTTTENGRSFIYTRLCHSSGQWMESNMEIKPPKSDIQTMGSYLTYLRRYMYAAMTGVVVSDEDDDGEVAMKATRSVNSVVVDSSKITKDQIQILSAELSAHPEILERLLKGLNIQKISDLPLKSYLVCIERIKTLKQKKED